MSGAPTGTAVEQYREPQAPALIGEREMKSIEYAAKTIAVLDNRFKKMKPDDRIEMALAIAITLHNLGLPVTVTNAKKLHLINGEPVESAQMLIGLLARCGHEVRVIEDSDDRAVVRGWRHGRGQPHEVIYTIDRARRSGALDEWVERWSGSQGNWKLEEKLVISRDGEEMNRPLPKWAEEQVAKGRVKRFDAWASYRADMLVNRAVRRLAKRMGGDALLGVSDRLDDDDEGPERVDLPAPPPVDDHLDDEIHDAELVEESGSGSAPSNEEAKQEPVPAFHPCCGHPVDGPHDVDCKGPVNDDADSGGTLDLGATET